MKCPVDCTCYRCLEKMADQKCKECEGDGYVIYAASTEVPGASETEQPCKCTEPARLRRAQKAARVQSSSESGHAK